MGVRGRMLCIMLTRRDSLLAREHTHTQQSVVAYISKPSLGRQKEWEFKAAWAREPSLDYEVRSCLKNINTYTFPTPKRPDVVALGRVRQEDPEFKGNLSYMVKLYPPNQR